MDKEKTEDKIISGINCNPETAKEEMEMTKEFFGKTEGRQYYHVIQSFKPGEVDQDKAHEIGKELANTKFENYECVVCTHIDKDHVHNHIVINSVNKETGRMYRSTKEDLREIKKANDRICEKESLSVPEEKKNRYFTMAEIKTAEKGDSLKFRLMNDIDIARDKSSSKKEFIKNMEKDGYKVNWTDSRKYITYTLPEGNKFRDKSLPSEYSKEVMENGYRGIEKEKQQNREEGRYTGEPREARGKRKDGQDIDRDFREFFGDKRSSAHHESQSNDSDRELHSGKERDGELERESRGRQESIVRSDEELRRNSEGGQKGKRRAERESDKEFKGRTGESNKRTERGQGETGELVLPIDGKVMGDQGTGETKFKDGTKTHKDSSHSKHNSYGDIDNHSVSVANTEAKIEQDISKEIIESVKRDLKEIRGSDSGEKKEQERAQGKLNNKENDKGVQKSKERTRDRGWER